MQSFALVVSAELSPSLREVCVALLATLQQSLLSGVEKFGMASRRPQSTPVGQDDDSSPSRARAASRAPSRTGATQIPLLTPINSWIGSPMGGQTQQQQAASSGSLLQASAAAPVAAPTSGAFSAEAAMGVIQAQSADPSPVYSDLRVDAHGEGAWKTAGTDFGCKNTPATGAEERQAMMSPPMEVDKDTGGVRHSKAEQRVGMKPSEGSTKNSEYSSGWKQVQSESPC